MAKRGTSKRFSVDQEEHIAKLYLGRRTPSSGAANNDSGDVRAPNDLIECKVTGRPGSPKEVKEDGRDLLSVFEKVSKEAFAEGRSPVVALRFFCPGSVNADPHGWVDLSVRLSEEDALHSQAYHDRYS